MASLQYIDLGRASYEAALELQQRLVERVIADPSLAYVILVEHDPPVITLGRSARAEHILASAGQLAELGITVHKTGRGGDVTYHGPGQLVGYPIIKLDPRHRSLHQYIRDIEESLIRTLAEFGIAGQREKGATGVWAGLSKVAAIGVAVRRWVAWHGFALNVGVNLSHFDLIVPCGLHGRGVTDISTLLARPVTVAEVKKPLLHSLAQTLELTIAE